MEKFVITIQDQNSLTLRSQCDLSAQWVCSMKINLKNCLTVV